MGSPPEPSAAGRVGRGQAAERASFARQGKVRDTQLARTKERNIRQEEQVNEQKKGSWGILGLLALIVVLFIGVKIAFAGLDLAIGQNQPDVIRQPLSTASGGDSQWMLLTKDDKNEEVTRWLEKADQDDQAYWLERQEAGEYVLYLPMQDRVIGVDDITVTQESGEDDS